jgi:hypothetical protein
MLCCSSHLHCNNRFLAKPSSFVLEQGAQVRAAQHIQTYVRYAILLRALRGVAAQNGQNCSQRICEQRSTQRNAAIKQKMRVLQEI